jgi:benzoate-CoA ligase
VVPTVFYGAPTGFAGLLAHPALPPRDAVRLRLVSSAGEALPASVGERFRDHFGVDIVDGIGSTEMLHIFLSNRPDAVRYGTTGWPVPGYEIELRGDDGQPVPDGEPGDLYIHGPSAALMYWGNRPRTRETFQAGGPRPATSTSGIRTVPTPTAAARTTCSRSAASTSARSRSRRR